MAGRVRAEPDYYGPGFEHRRLLLPSIDQPVIVRAAEPPPPPPLPVAAQYAGGPAYNARHTVYRRRPARSLAKSAIAIVAGSAGTPGAAIGAIAGGGPGAAIGAIAGGTGGFIYDRSTAHH